MFLLSINFLVSLKVLWFFFLTMFFLVFSGLIFSSRNVLVFMIYLELLYLNLSFLFIFLSGLHFNPFGELFSFLLLSIAASEAAIGFSLTVLLLNNYGTVFFKDFHKFHG